MITSSLGRWQSAGRPCRVAVEAQATRERGIPGAWVLGERGQPASGLVGAWGRGNRGTRTACRLYAVVGEDGVVSFTVFVPLESSFSLVPVQTGMLLYAVSESVRRLML